MNKSELIAAIAEHADITKQQAGMTLDAFIEIATAALKANDTIALVGFGTFSVKDRAARTGRSPATGEPIQIPASRVPHFAAGKGLKGAVNGRELR